MSAGTILHRTGKRSILYAATNKPQTFVQQGVNFVAVMDGFDSKWGSSILQQSSIGLKHSQC